MEKKTNCVRGGWTYRKKNTENSRMREEGAVKKKGGAGDYVG